MNRFWVVLTVLFVMNLITSASVSADNYFFRNGIESYQKGIKHYENKRYNEGDNSFEDSIEFLEEALKKKLAPSQENQAHLRLGISRYYVGKAEQAIESLNSALRQGKLNGKHQAEAHLYWGMSLLAIRKHLEAKAREQFEKALKLNSSLKFPSSLEHEKQAKNLFEEARKKPIPIDKTPPTIRLLKPNNGATFIRRLITISAKVTDDTSIKEVLIHFSPTDKRNLSKEGSSDIYTKVIWVTEAETLRYYLTATDEAGNKERYPKTGKLKITVVEVPSDKTSPTIHLLKPNDGATFEVNHQITISAKVTDDISVESVYLVYGVSQVRSSEPSRYYSKPLTQTSTGTYRTTIPGRSDAEYIWYYLTATDEAGNERRYPKTGKLKIRIEERDDETPPTIHLLKPNDGATFKVYQLITIRAKVTDDSSIKEVLVHFSLTDKRNLSKEGSSDIYTTVIRGTDAGILRYYLTATDEAGNERRYPKTGKLKIRIEERDDETPPTIHLLKPNDGATFKVNQLITISAKVTDNISVKEVYVHFPSDRYKLSRERSSDIYTTVIWVTEAETLRYYLTATDEAGNKERYPKTKKLKIIVTEEHDDEISPIIRLLEPHDGATFKANQLITIRAKVTDDTAVKEVSLYYGVSQSNSLGPSEYHSEILTKTLVGHIHGIYSVKKRNWIHLLLFDCN